MKLVAFSSRRAPPLALLLAFAPEAHADLIPWAYSWSNSPTQIHADAPGTGTISLSNEKSGTAVGDSDIVATNLKTASTASAANPDVFTAKSYALTLTLTDLAIGHERLDDLHRPHQRHPVERQFQPGEHLHGPDDATDRPRQHGLHDHHQLVHAPRPSEFEQPRQHRAHATVTVSHVIVQSLPEPGTLALSLLGLAACGAGRWRLRRGRRAIQ